MKLEQLQKEAAKVKSTKTSMAGVIEGQDKETLTCKICYQVFDNPKALPCMHTYCCDCLDKLVTKESDANKLKCPECRQEHVVPQRGVKDFKVSFTTKILVEIFNAGDTENKPQCKICQGTDTNAVAKCLECNKTLCKSCVNSHDAFTTGHTVVELTGNQSHDMKKALKTVKDRIINCPKHNVPLQIYCKIDRCALCPTCFVIDHSGHGCMDIHQAAEENVKQIEETLIHGQTLMKHYETAIHDTYNTIGEMETDMDNAVDELTNDMNAAIQHIRDTYTRNINSIKTKKDTCTKQTIAHLGYLEGQKILIESTMNQLSTVKDYGHNAELADMGQDIESKLENWKNTPDVAFKENVSINVHRGELFDDRIVFAYADNGSHDVQSFPNTGMFLPMKERQKTKSEKRMSSGIMQGENALKKFKEDLPSSKEKTGPSAMDNITGKIAVPENEDDLSLFIKREPDGIESGHEVKVTESEYSKSTKNAPKLPPGLSKELESVIEKLKDASTKTIEWKKFFTTDNNKLLLQVDNLSSQISRKERSDIYNHLAAFLPCTKKTLLKRSKKLQQNEQLNVFEDSTIEGMPEQTDKYERLVATNQIEKQNPVKTEITHSSTDEKGRSNSDKAIANSRNSGTAKPAASTQSEHSSQMHKEQSYTQPKVLILDSSSN